MRWRAISPQNNHKRPGRPRGQCHRDTVCVIREQFLRHYGPGRTAGCRHKRQFLRNFVHKILCLLCRTEIRSDRNFKDIRKTKLFHRRTQFSRRYFRSELADKRRCQCCIDALSRLDRTDYLEDLGFVRNSAERAVDETLAAGYTFLVIDIRFSVLI